MTRAKQRTIYTVGHSTHPIEEFIAMLKAHGVAQLADVRTIPGSRHNPQFGERALKSSLEEAGITYARLAALGGLRRTTKDSINTGWRNASFRGYADYMGTPEFAAGLSELEETASETPTAIMCAEAVPWRCHRSLIADALETAGWNVLDIMSEDKATPHRLTPFLHVKDGVLTYPKSE